MENKSFAADKKEIIEQVLQTYESFMRHRSCREVEEELGLSRNVVQRNLTTRLKLISKEKYEQVKYIIMIAKEKKSMEEKFAGWEGKK